MTPEREREGRLGLAQMTAAGDQCRAGFNKMIRTALETGDGCDWLQSMLMKLAVDPGETAVPLSPAERLIVARGASLAIGDACADVMKEILAGVDPAT